MTDQPGITLNIDAGRVFERDGAFYLKLEQSDFAALGREELIRLHNLADMTPEDSLPITITLRGGKLPEGEDLRLVWPDGNEASALVRDAASGQQLAIPSVSGGRSPALDVAAAMMRGDDILGPTVQPDLLGRTTMTQRAAEISHAMRTAPKRSLEGRRGDQPTLSDKLLFNRHAHVDKVPRKVAEAISAAHRASRVFVFDRAASYRVGELCAYSADLIADQQEFARTPYPRTFVEMDNNAVLQAMRDAGLATFETADEKDERLGFLYTERGIYTAASHIDGNNAGWSPFAYRPHQPMTQEQERRFMDEFGGGGMVQLIDRFFWGSSYETLDPTRRRSLRLQHGLDVLLPEGWAGTRRAPLMNLLQGGGAGDLKVALCAALLLIRPNLLVTQSERAASRKLHLGKPTTFLAHRVVTIKLNPDRLVRRITKACKEERGRARARWHEVRGHYCHNHRAKVAQCVHDWNEVAPLKWECLRGCGGLRWWRECPNGRGDASIGVVTKHYVVKP